MEEKNEVEAPEPPKLTLDDISVVANIIDAAVQRGAFKAQEAKAVGEAYEKLVTFIQYVAGQQKKEEV